MTIDRLVMYVSMMFCVLSPAQIYCNTHNFSPPRGNIAGVVRDADAEGVQNVEITIFKDSQPLRSILSAARGEYRIIDLEPGQYTLQFTHPQKLVLSRRINVHSSRNSFCNIRFGSVLSLSPPRLSTPRKIIEESAFIKAIKRPVPVSGAYAQPYLPPQEQHPPDPRSKTSTAD